MQCGRSASTPKRHATAASASLGATSSPWPSRGRPPAGLRVRRLSEPVRIAGVGILLGALALWLVLPPVVVRSIAVPLIVGACGVAAGSWAIREGSRRAGWGAVASGLLGMVGGV